MINNPLVIWRFVDGKPGHEKQTQALIEGIEHHATVQVHSIAIGNLQHIKRALIFGSWSELSSLPTPDLILGAGHKTHWPVLAAKRVFGGKTVILMNPSLPTSWFDAVITPAHDGYRQTDRRLVSTTALAPGIKSQADHLRGLILMGGISKHFIWNDDYVCQRIIDIADHTPEIHWALSNSRRTPKTTSQKLKALCDDKNNLTFYEVTELDASWLPQQLGQAGTVWISSDSASMVAEALNSAAKVGVIKLPTASKKNNNKLLLSVDNLIKHGDIGYLTDKDFLPPPSRSGPANYHIEVAQQLLDCLAIKTTPKAS